MFQTLSDTLSGLLAEKKGFHSADDHVGDDLRPAPTAATNLPVPVSAQMHHAPASGSQPAAVVDALCAESTGAEPQSREAPTAAPAVAGDSVPEILREALEAEVTDNAAWSPRRIAFGLGSVMLLVVLATQAAWFFSQPLSARYPALLPALAKFCQYSGCELAQQRDPSKIQMISRDVRAHPDYEGALRVVATMVNQLPYAQPYPQMRFTLFNVNGDEIVGRTFRPDEYLPSVIDVSAGMPSREAVQIELDLLALEEAAVSFEFRFL